MSEGLCQMFWVDDDGEEHEVEFPQSLHLDADLSSDVPPDAAIQFPAPQEFSFTVEVPLTRETLRFFGLDPLWNAWMQTISLAAWRN